MTVFNDRPQENDAVEAAVVLKVHGGVPIRALKHCQFIPHTKCGKPCIIH